MYRSSRWLTAGVIAALSFAGGAIAARAPKPPKDLLPPWNHPQIDGAIPAEWGELRASRANVGPLGFLEMTFEAGDGTIRIVELDLAARQPRVTLVLRRVEGLAASADAATPEAEH